MNFNEAIEVSPMIQRQGWNGKGMFVFKQVPSEVPMAIVSKMQSLPTEVKEEFWRRKNEASDNGNMIMSESNPLSSIRYVNQLAIVYPDNSIHGWSPSPADILANDWFPYEVPVV